MYKIQLLQEILQKSQELEFTEKHNLNEIIEYCEMYISKFFGDNSKYISKLKNISFPPSNFALTNDFDWFVNKNRFESEKKSLLRLIIMMKDDLLISGSLNQESVNNNKELSSEIFIVHGHNEEMKQSTARLIEKLNLKPIILHEQPNKGRTIIEKFTDSSNVSFAIVLLSADDIAYKKDDKPENWKYRARQNVILELGFFIGKLGRKYVIALHEKVDNFEIPSDYQGVLFIPYENNDSWKFEIIQELQSVGYDVDANLLTRNM